MPSTDIESISTTPPKPKSISMLILKPRDVRPASKNQFHFDHHHPHENEVNRSSQLKQLTLGPHTVNLGPLHKKQVTLDPNTKAKTFLFPHNKIWLVSIPLLKSSQLDPCSKIKSMSISPQKERVNVDRHTKTKYFSTLAQKRSQFRPLHWIQVNFDGQYKIKSILMPRNQHQVNLDPYSETK